MSFGDNLQAILTQGLDAVKTVKLAKLQVNDPTPRTSGPNGLGAAVGQAAYGLGGAVSSLAPVLVLAGVAIAAILVVKLVGKR